MRACVRRCWKLPDALSNSAYDAAGLADKCCFLDLESLIVVRA